MILLEAIAVRAFGVSERRNWRNVCKLLGSKECDSIRNDRYVAFHSMMCFAPCRESARMDTMLLRWLLGSSFGGDECEACPRLLSKSSMLGSSRSDLTFAGMCAINILDFSSMPELETACFTSRFAGHEEFSCSVILELKYLQAFDSCCA